MRATLAEFMCSEKVSSATFDGASVNQGTKRHGLRAILGAADSNMKHVHIFHCGAHVLALAVGDVKKNCLAMKYMANHMNLLRYYFGKSGLRKAQLERHIQELPKETRGKRKGLPGPGSTRWLTLGKTINAAVILYQAVMNTLYSTKPS